MRGQRRRALREHVVSFEGESSLDSILSRKPIPLNVDFLSIDIDGADYHIWDCLKPYQPKVVVTGFNSFIASNIEFVQARDMRVMHGSSMLSMTKLAASKGQELISINQENAFFVQRGYSPLFQIADDTIDALKHFRELLQVFQLYDGTLVFHGTQWIHYAGVRADYNKHLQVLPKFVRDAHLPWAERSLKNLCRESCFGCGE
jgi:hypothetical protein